MSEARTCPQCGAELRDAALEGLCPDCLGKLALGSEGEGQSLKAKGQSAGGAAAAGEVGRDVPIAPLSAIQLPVSSIEHPAARFGDYELLSEIAHGGMGVVFKARQTSLNRTVAVKMIRAGPFASKEFVHRFRVEASAAAVLQHPNIVAVHEVGVHEGQHFFSMDYVAGQNLAQIVRDGPLPANRAARYVQKIAEAIHYAHQSGILHRDLKPSNVLIDANDQPRITDFGLAKQLNVESSATLTGDVMGTPGYMPPEQASGNRGAVKAWSDVYSLGAVLYHLLTGRAPFAAGSLEETLHQVLHQDPVSIRLLNAAVPRDLDTICLKCLEKEPVKRYASAQLLAEELTRFLNKEPILARPIGALGKGWRWCRRKPALAASLGAVVLLLGAVALVSTFSAVRQRELRQRAEDSAAQAQATVTRLEIDRAEMLFEDDQSADALAYLARVMRREPTNRVAAERIMSVLAHRNFCVPLFRLQHKHAIVAAEFSPDGQLIVTASKDGTTRLWDGRTGQSLFGPLQHTVEVTSARFSADGKRLVTTSLDKTARIWDSHTGQALSEPLRHEAGVLCADFSPDGQRLLTGSADGLTRLWDATTGAATDTMVKLVGPVNFVKYSPDGKWIALASLSGRDVRIVTAGDGTQAAAFALWGGSGGSDVLGGTVAFPSFSADGTRVVTYHQTGSLHGLNVWTAAARSNWVIQTTHTLRLSSARFSPDGQYLASSATDGIAGIWDASTGQPVGEAMKHENWVNSIEFSPDGQQVVTGGKDHTARIWDARTGRPLTEPLRHDASVLSVQFSPDGQRILSLCEGPVVWVWEVRCAQPFTASLQHSPEGSVRRAVFSPDGQRLATTTWGGTRRVRLWDARRAIPLMPPFGSGSHDVQFSGDGRLVLAADGRTSMTTVWDAGTGKIVGGPFRHTNVTCARFSPDGQLVLTAGSGPQVRVWRIVTGMLVAEFAHEASAEYAQFSPDGQWVVTTSADRTARLWDWRTSQPLMQPLLHDDAVVWADVSADSRRLVTISRDKAARIWEIHTGTLLHTLLHAEEPYHYHSVQFSPDGRWVVTAAGNAAQIWDSRTGQPNTAPLKHDGRVNSVRFNLDGRRVVTASTDSSARIWDVDTGHLLSEPLRHRARVIYAEFSPDGRWVVTASDDETAQIWEVPALSSIPPWLADCAESMAGQRLDRRSANQSVPFDQLIRLRSQLERDANGGEGAAWAKWFFAENTLRTISPSSVITVPQWAERRIQEDTSESLQQAVRVFPTNALAQARLAWAMLTGEAVANARQMANADWQSLRACRLAPGDTGVLRTRAEVCVRLGRLAEALQTMDQASGLRPTNAAFWNAWGLMLEKTNRVDDALEAYSKAIELSGPWKGPHVLPARAWRNRATLLKRLGRLSEARFDYLKALNVSDRQAETPPRLIDLTSYYNRGLDLTGEPFWDFTGMPMGRVSLEGVEFDLRGAIQLSTGLIARDIGASEHVVEIAIRQRCRLLSFLHFGYTTATLDGVKIGAYRMHYADGEFAELPLAYGYQMRTVTPDSDPKDSLASDTTVGWSGITPDNRPIRLFLTAWKNPRPDMMIESLDFVSNSNRVIPFLFALTAEP